MVVQGAWELSHSPTLPLFCAPYAIQKSIGSIGENKDLTEADRRRPRTDDVHGQSTSVDRVRPCKNCQVLSVSMEIWVGTEAGKVGARDGRCERGESCERGERPRRSLARALGPGKKAPGTGDVSGERDCGELHLGR